MGCGWNSEWTIYRDQWRWKLFDFKLKLKTYKFQIIFISFINLISNKVHMCHLNLLHIIFKRSNFMILPTSKIQDYHHEAVKVFSDCENCSNIFIIIFVPEISSIYSVHFGNFFQILRKKEIKLLLHVCLDLW